MEKKISKLTNSEIGSVHWFNTLINEIGRIGMALTTIKEAVPEEEIYILRQWGETIRANVPEIRQWYNDTGLPDKELMIHALETTLNKLKNEK